ncbi:MAG: carboxypeptidase regulatory-like domain-containing protein [Hamadaea sp.]|nr:carboxypeptidase regulatory-like domain-containing protein [Hamadaea sp.]
MTVPGEPPGAWPDEIDAAVLDGLRDLHDLLDPPPADLTDRVLFALAVADLGDWDRALDAEIARIQADQLVGSGARSGERTRTISFDAPSLAVMVTVVDLPDGRLRLDGWLAPAAPLRVELRVGPQDAVRTLTTDADAGGRFVFASVPHGLVQLVVRGTGVQTVVTPSVVL